jgi:two-component system OmpR family sensor kinase
MSSSLRADQLETTTLELGEGTEPVAPLRPPAERPRWVSPRSWTLRTKLVASMLALFTVVSIVTGAATVLFLNRYLNSQTDQLLQVSISRIVREPGQPPGPGGSRRGPGDEGLTAYISGDTSVLQTQGVATDLESGYVALTSAELATVDAAGLGGAQPQNLHISDRLGNYRLLAKSAQYSVPGSPSIPVVVVVGLPLERQQATIVNTAVAVTGGVLLGLVAVGIGGTWLVRRNLRPLDRVAATATRVSHLPLSEGQVDIAERVPAADTDTNTEVGQVGAAFNEMLDHIDNALNARQKSEERVRQFVADASHELRTPLASIRGYAELTRREQEPVPRRVTHAIGRVESEAVRMTALVDDLLLLARLDAGRPLDHETVDLTEMVVNAVSDAHAAAPDHVWQLDLPDEPVIIQGDPARLHQIVANLLGNARTHTAPGTVVRTSIVLEPHQVRLMVRDNGPGVPKELQSDVFQRFARGDTSRNRAAGSTGLGLSIVAAVAQAHGGSVSLDSVPGDTTFTVMLPA